MSLDLEQKYSVVSKNGEIWELSLKELLAFSDKTLLFFYPKDNTPGCTVENKDFSCMASEYANLWITLMWVSKDSVESPS